MVATWGDYQSVIQLAAGLNFAYASLEVILERPLLVLSSRQQALIDRVRELVKARSAPNPAVDAVVFSRLRQELRLVTKSHAFFCYLNPYVSAFCGVASTALLFHASHYPGEPVSPADFLLISTLGYAWFCVTLLVMASLRLFLLSAVEPKLKKIEI